MIEFLAVGNELLSGDTVNGNAATLGRRLAEIGAVCTRHTAVGDDATAIGRTLRDALSRSRFVVVSGGLGPTEDDLTREAVAAALGRRLVRAPAIAASLREKFASFGREMPERNLVQADVIEGATVIETTWGTAPGMIVSHGDAVVYLLPGVPGELDDMLVRAVLPDLVARGVQGVLRAETVHVAGMPESEIASRLREVWNGLPSDVSMAYLPADGEVRIRFTARGDSESSLPGLVSRTQSLLGEAVVGTGDENLDAAVASLFRLRGLTLAAGESLTGGGFGERCTRLPGASAWFRGSLVCYATEAKTAILGVPASLIEEAGVVSVEVARAMAAGARSLLAADVGVGLTGVAGPDEQRATVGTVCVAVVADGIDDARAVTLPGDRARIRRLATTTALTLLARTLRR